MYSRNDYWDYLNDHSVYSDDVLMHYGVKGMKWKDHKYAKGSILGSNTVHRVRLRTRLSNMVDSNTAKKVLKRTARTKIWPSNIKRTHKKNVRDIKRAKAIKKVLRTSSTTKKDIKDFVKNRKKVASNVKKEAKDAYNSQKKDIQKIAKNASKKVRVESKVPSKSQIRKKANSIEGSVKKKANSIEKSVKKKAKVAGRKAQSIERSAKKKAKAIGRTTSQKANKATSTMKSKAKKAYKYADDHVDRYSYRQNGANGSYSSAGVRVRTKNSSTDIGVYNRTQKRKNRKGKTVTSGGDFGFEVARNNKKKRKASYTSGGLGTRSGVPVYVYRRGSKKY